MASQVLAPQPAPATATGHHTPRTPTVLIVDSDREAIGHCAQMLENLHYPHIGVSSSREALDHLGRDPSIEIVAACPHMPAGGGFVLIEEARTRIGTARPLAFIVVTDRITTDLALRGLHAEAVDLLSKPLGFEEWTLALRRANRYLSGRRVSGNPLSAAVFEQQLGQIMALLGANAPHGERQGPASDEDIAATLAAIINARAMRGRYFAGQVFADPAWDILLDLARARLEGQQVSVSSVCIAASVPMSTALRWVKQMTDANLLRRWTDPKDRRRDLIALTEPTADRMREYLALAHKRFSAL